tara:strand:+ start:151 stop:354 length:204 start_codon:yes stop_codon:yes gene_type:complete
MLIAEIRQQNRVILRNLSRRKEKRHPNSKTGVLRAIPKLLHSRHGWQGEEMELKSRRQEKAREEKEN